MGKFYVNVRLSDDYCTTRDVSARVTLMYPDVGEQTRAWAWRPGTGPTDTDITGVEMSMENNYRYGDSKMIRKH